jgi:pilus assembly protein CpaB
LGRIEIDPTMNNPVFLLPSEKPRPRLVSQTMLQDIVILGLGTFTGAEDQPIAAPAPESQPTPTPASQAQDQTPPEKVVPDVVTLIVAPQDAVTLNYLMLAGANMNLVLRSAGDSEVKNTEAVTLQFILDQYQIPNPAKLPYGLEPRLDGFPSSIQPFPEPVLAPTAPASQ